MKVTASATAKGSCSQVVHHDAGALNTYGLDVGYFISPSLHASVGYYYQHRDQEDVDGSGVRGRLAYDITQGLTAGVNISYDEAFDSRVSADLQVRFGGPSTTATKKKKWESPTINALTASPKNRDVRIHDCNVAIIPPTCFNISAY